ncbi:hypothetical protein LTS14_008094 [Recurvomyces mirabilis]|uniref:uncharacterized protein n=1 Tax=Recurvomyces mirabilis TaxID=574656 RepID=UPI002DDF4437|nr:hypothetical protein LTS14_008094 [Recurvomyces mirabilis]
MTMLPGPYLTSWKIEDRPDEFYIPRGEQSYEMMQTYSPLWQPMERFQQKHEGPIYHPGPVQEHIMQPYPDVMPRRMSMYIGSESSMDSPHQRYASPSNSGHSVSHASSTLSEHDWSPHPSPFIRNASYPPELSVDKYFHGYGFYGSIEHMSGYPGGHCVAMHDVQRCADAQAETILSEEETTTYGSYAQEGYQPMQLATPVSVATPCSQICQAEADYKPVQEPAPVYRRRRTNSSRSSTSPVLSVKVTKRPHAARRRSSNSNGRTNNSNEDNTGARPFPCPFATYECSSTFASKNEWKRHVTTQHLRLGFWRCDQCPNGERKPNDFNRKDLFIQHVRRMHPVSADAKKATTKSRSPRRGSRGSNKSDATEEELLAEVERRCYRQTRTAPEQSGCMFCDKKFKTWEERMEHVGRHMDSATQDNGAVTDPADWQTDKVTEDWLVKEKLVRQSQGRLVLV